MILLSDHYQNYFPNYINKFINIAKPTNPLINYYKVK
jgi:hypothetical protein